MLCVLPLYAQSSERAYRVIITNTSTIEIPDATLYQPVAFYLRYNSELYIADQGNRRIAGYAIDSMTGAYRAQILNLIGPDEPIAIAVDNNGIVYTIDAADQQLKAYTLHGDIVTNSFPDSFINPVDIFIDSHNYYYILDAGASYLYVYNTQREQILKIGSFGSAPRQFIDPTAVFVDYNNTIYVVDSGNNRIKIFRENGSFSNSIGQNEIYSQPQSITVDKNGFLYLADTGNRRILVYSPDYQLIKEINTTLYPFGSPVDVLTHPNGDLYVLDKLNNEIIEINVQTYTLAKNEALPVYENEVYTLYTVREEMAATGRRSVYGLAHGYILPGSIHIYAAGKEQIIGQDVYVDYIQGHFDFVQTTNIEKFDEVTGDYYTITNYRTRSMPYGQPIVIDYQYIPINIKSEYGTTNIGMPHQTISETREQEYHINVSGSQRFSITFGSDGQIQQQAPLDLNFYTKIEKTVVQGKIAGHDLRLQTAGATEELSELDRIYIEINNPHYTATLGDLNINIGNTYFAKYKKSSLKGLFTTYAFTPSEGAFLIARSRTHFNTSRFKGDATSAQGPYDITINQQNASIISGSESVWVNGIKLKRGNENEYTINYSKGQLSFDAANSPIITAESEIIIDYQYLTAHYPTESFMAQSFGQTKKKQFRIGLTYLSEIDRVDDSLILLSDIDKAVLSNSMLYDYNNDFRSFYTNIFNELNDKSNVRANTNLTRNDMLDKAPGSASIIDIKSTLNKKWVTMDVESAVNYRDENQFMNYNLHYDDPQLGASEIQPRAQATRGDITFLFKELESVRHTIGDLTTGGYFYVQDREFHPISGNRYDIDFVDRWELRTDNEKSSLSDYGINATYNWRDLWTIGWDAAQLDRTFEDRRKMRYFNEVTSQFKNKNNALIKGDYKNIVSDINYSATNEIDRKNFLEKMNFKTELPFWYLKPSSTLELENDYTASIDPSLLMFGHDYTVYSAGLSSYNIRNFYAGYLFTTRQEFEKNSMTTPRLAKFTNWENSITVQRSIRNVWDANANWKRLIKRHSKEYLVYFPDSQDQQTDLFNLRNYLTPWGNTIRHTLKYQLTDQVTKIRKSGRSRTNKRYIDQPTIRVTLSSSLTVAPDKWWLFHNLKTKTNSLLRKIEYQNYINIEEHNSDKDNRRKLYFLQNRMDIYRTLTARQTIRHTVRLFPNSKIFNILSSLENSHYMNGQYGNKFSKSLRQKRALQMQNAVASNNTLSTKYKWEHYTNGSFTSVPFEDNIRLWDTATNNENDYSTSHTFELRDTVNVPPEWKFNIGIEYKTKETIKDYFQTNLNRIERTFNAFSNNMTIQSPDQYYSEWHWAPFLNIDFYPIKKLHFRLQNKIYFQNFMKELGFPYIRGYYNVDGNKGFIARNSLYQRVVNPRSLSAIEEMKIKGQKLELKFDANYNITQRIRATFKSVYIVKQENTTKDIHGKTVFTSGKVLVFKDSSITVTTEVRITF